MTNMYHHEVYFFVVPRLRRLAHRDHRELLPLPILSVLAVVHRIDYNELHRMRRRLSSSPT